MKSLLSLLAVTLLGAAPVALSQVNLPNPQAPGSSPDTAVRITATNEMMVDRVIKRWLRQHYPGWDAEPHEFQDIGMERYAVVYITAPNNPGRKVYFRLFKSQAEENNDGFPPAF